MNTNNDVSRTGGATAILWVLAIIGGVTLLGTGGSAAFAAAAEVSRSDSTGSEQSVDVDGIRRLDLDVSASDMRVEFADVDEASLSVTTARGSWRLERDGDELIVRSPDTVFGWWFGRWFDVGEERVVLTLPESLAGELDADMTLNAGRLDVDGEFHELDTNVNAGALSVDGSTQVLGVDVSAGRADLVLADVEQAELKISAGGLTVELTGDAPASTTIDASAGSVNLTVPDVQYRLLQDVSAGTVNSTLDESSTAERTIEVDLSAGSVNLHPSR